MEFAGRGATGGGARSRLGEVVEAEVAVGARRVCHYRLFYRRAGRQVANGRIYYVLGRRCNGRITRRRCQRQVGREIRPV